MMAFVGHIGGGIITPWKMSGLVLDIARGRLANKLTARIAGVS